MEEVASDVELSAANALMAVSSVGSTILGFTAAGILAVSFNINWAFYLDALSFLFSGAFIFFAHIPYLPRVENTSVRAIGQNLQAGLRTVSTIPILRSLFIVAIPIFMIFGMQNALLLPFTLHALGATEFHFGLQQASEAIGVTIGSLIMARLSDRIREGQWLAISYLSMAIATLVFSLSHVVAFAIFLMGLSGLLNAPSYLGRQLVIQRATPREMRGRVNSAFFVVRDVMVVLGMSLAGLADIFNVRTLFVITSFALMAAGIVVLILPGLAQPATEWKRTLSLLRGIEAAPRLGAGRAANRSEIDRFISYMAEMAGMTAKERDQLAAQTLIANAPGGKIVVYRGEASNSAYFILKGSVGVGFLQNDDYVIMAYLHAGDFFGEIAALTGAARTANVITEEESEFLILPARVMRQLAKQYDGLRAVFYATMAQRISSIELPRGTSLDQDLLRELRTNAPVPKVGKND